MKTFKLLRHEDITGISGTGVVAEGVEFSKGHVVVAWLSDKPSIVIHENIENVLAIHGHGGKTELIWNDEV